MQEAKQKLAGISRKKHIFAS